MKIDKSDILSLLRDSKDYVSGQQLCDQFGVSRTAVWKVINQLKAEGYQIEAVSHKGYRLLESPDVLSRSEIASKQNGPDSSYTIWRRPVPPILMQSVMRKKESRTVQRW